MFNLKSNLKSGKGYFLAEIINNIKGNYSSSIVLKNIKII